MRPARLRSLATVKSQARYSERRFTPAFLSLRKIRSKRLRRRSIGRAPVRILSR
jgi:hypothetical protein